MFRVVGVPESSVAPIVKKILKAYGNVYIKTHPKGHEIRAPVLDVYVMGASENLEEAERTVNEVVERLISELKGLGGRIESVSA
jgi:molybdopterin-biosynthesis enzyme MoeA-like protein